MRTAVAERTITGVNKDFLKSYKQVPQPVRTAAPAFKFCHAAQALAYAS